MNGDFDSDSGFVTNDASVVRCAKIAYKDYPTIVNNIPQNKKKYNNTLEDFALVDNLLSHAQIAIGSSSNLAQIAQTYMYSFPNQNEFNDYVCILAVLAQVAIDNAKRSFAIDVNEEIKIIKDKMRVNDSDRLYPKFWLGVNPNINKVYNDFVRSLKSKKKKGEMLTEEEIYALSDLNKINDNLICPMNCVYNYKFEKNKSEESTLPMDYFFQKYKLEDNRRKNKKVEELIEEYSKELSEYYKNIQDKSLELSDAITMGNFLEEDLEELTTKIRGLYLNSSYIGLTSWLIDRAFCISPQSKGANNRDYRSSSSNINKNKSLLLKVLYDINPNNVIKCFSKNLEC